MTLPEDVTLCCNIVFTMRFNAIDIHHGISIWDSQILVWLFSETLTMSKSANPFLSHKKHVTPACLYIATCSFNIEEHYSPSLTTEVSTQPTVSSFVGCSSLRALASAKKKQR